MKNNDLSPKEQRILDMTERIAELIKTANTTSPIELAVFLVKNGVVDSKELKRQIKAEIIDWEIIWH